MTARPAKKLPDAGPSNPQKCVTSYFLTEKSETTSKTQLAGFAPTMRGDRSGARRCKDLWGVSLCIGSGRWGQSFNLAPDRRRPCGGRSVRRASQDSPAVAFSWPFPELYCKLGIVTGIGQQVDAQAISFIFCSADKLAASPIGRQSSVSYIQALELLAVPENHVCQFMGRNDGHKIVGLIIEEMRRKLNNFSV